MLSGAGLQELILQALLNICAGSQIGEPKPLQHLMAEEDR